MNKIYEPGINNNGDKMLLVLIEFILGSFMHFLYNLCPYFIIAIIAPINESIFEHLKLAMYPMLLVSLIVLWYRRKLNRKTLTALFCAILVSIVTIVLFYYFYRYGLGIESLVLDILLLLIAIAIGNVCGVIVYKHKLEMNKLMLLIMYSSLIFIFTLFTFFPSQLPLFISQ